MMAGPMLDSIKGAILDVQADTGHTGHVAAFMRHETRGSLHCEVRVYFPPAAAHAARLLGAVPVNRPERDGLSMLAGPRSAWELWFPERRE